MGWSEAGGGRHGRSARIAAAVAIAATVVAGLLPAGGHGGTAEAADDLEVAVDRLAGPERFATAAEIARHAFPDGALVAFVATGGDFADALTGGPASAAAGGPLLLTAAEELPAPTGAELERLAPQRVVVLGGEEAVAAPVEQALAGYADEVERWTGEDRFATAATVADHTHPDGAEVVLLATGGVFADALAGGAAAAALDAPVLLTASETLPDATAEALQALAPRKLVVLGGQAAVSEGVADVAAAAAGLVAGDVERLAGRERIETARRVAEHVFAAEAVDTVYVATGRGFADALAGMPAAATAGAPMLLVDASDAPVRAAIAGLHARRAVLLGGTAAVGDHVLAPYTGLVGRLDALLARADLPSSLGYALVDPGGRLVHGRDPDAPLLPASTQKLLTAATALETFGAEHRLRTQVHAEGPIDDGVLRGDLVVTGGGDPALGDVRWAAIRPRRPITSLEALAEAVADAGISHVAGRVVGWAGVLPWQPQAPGWPPRYLDSGDTTLSSGLTVNGGHRVWREGDEWRYEPAGRPAGETVRLLTGRLDEEGVAVDGDPHVTSTEPAGGDPLVELESPAIAELLAYAVTWSDNHIADTLWRMAGREEGDGSWQSGADAATATLARLGIDAAGTHFADGSGLSRDNRMTARLLAELDLAMTETRAGRWRNLKAVAGETGTLRNRLEGTDAAGVVHAKTGWLRDVRALAGSVDGPQGRWHFALVGNDLDRAGDRAVRDFSDDVAVVLARHARGCELSGC